MFSSGLKSLLNACDEMEVIAEGISPETLAMHLYHKTPDIILINMLHCNNAGIRTVKRIKKYFPDVPLLLITSKDFTDCFTDYINLGARGFVFSDDSVETLIESIKQLCIGKIYFQETQANNISLENRKNILTDRELDVLKLFCNGLTYKEIGKTLYISPRTVESHKKNILVKLKISSTAEMVKYATRNRLISN